MEETGWKLVHGDVFRPPPLSKLLTTLVGTGMQIFGMGMITICKFSICRLAEALYLWHMVILLSISSNI